MSLWAIVPVKPFQQGKSRLSKVFSVNERVALNRALFSQTINTLLDVRQIDRILVVSRDPDVLTLSLEHRVAILKENGTDLNSALKQATLWAAQNGACAILIVPEDLPLLTSREVEELLERSGEPPRILVVPDRWYSGTNILWMSPPGIVDYCFGPDSYKRHLKRASDIGIQVEVYRSPTLQFDLDLPEDVKTLEQMEGFDFQSLLTLLRK